MDLVFKCLSAPIRREILSLLSDKEMSASEISDNFPVSKPTMSHHLKLLKDAGLISVRRDGNTLYYRLSTSVVEDIYRYVFSLKEKK